MSQTGVFDAVHERIDPARGQLIHIPVAQVLPHVGDQLVQRGDVGKAAALPRVENVLTRQIRQKITIHVQPRKNITRARLQVAFEPKPVRALLGVHWA